MVRQLLDTENDQIRKLHNIVVNAIEEEKLLSQKLYEFEDNNPSFGSRLADKVAIFGGSWKFVTAFLMFLLIWILANIYLLSKPFDVYPFILLNLILSTIAALQAPSISCSQPDSMIVSALYPVLSSSLTCRTCSSASKVSTSVLNS